MNQVMRGRGRGDDNSDSVNIEEDKKINKKDANSFLFFATGYRCVLCVQIRVCTFFFKFFLLIFF